MQPPPTASCSTLHASLLTQAQLGVSSSLPFYLVLSHFYASARGADTALTVMQLLQVRPAGECIH